MKIAIPVNEKGLKASVSTNFGRATYFLIYDSETKQETYIENPGRNASGGAGPKAAQVVMDAGADHLITPRLGENAANAFAKTEIYEAHAGSVEQHIEDLIGGNLNPLNKISKGLHGHM